MLLRFAAEPSKISRLNINELDDYFDIIGLSLQGLFEILRSFSPGNQACQSLSISASPVIAGRPAISAYAIP
jgi:hypothetical protein